MNLFAISALIAVISNLSMALLVYSKRALSKADRMWIYLCLGVAFWSFAALQFSLATSENIAFMWWKIGYSATIFLPAIYAHFVFCYLKIDKKFLIRAMYGLSVFFLAINWLKPEWFLNDLKYVFNQFYWHDWISNKNVLFIVFYLLYYWALLLYASSLLFLRFISSKGAMRQQMKYLTIGSIIGWMGPHGFYLIDFGIELYPSSGFCIAIYPIFITYAIIKHQLMDINIVIKKSLIYSILLAAISTTYLIFVFGISRLFQGFIGYQSFTVNIIAIFLIGLVFNPLKNRIQIFLDKRFFEGTLESLAQEKQHLQQELFHKEKLAYVGQMASAVAHEIRNPLTAIKTYCEYLSQKHNDPNYREKFRQIVPAEISRIEKVVNNLLDLAKPRGLNLQPVKITQVIDSTLTLLEDTFSLKKIAIKNEYESEDILVNGDSEQLRQVFLNLFLNAIQAMNNGGVLTIGITQMITDKKKRMITDKIRDHQCSPSVIICVSDTGKGMSDEQLKTLFTPFQTTKEDGIGLGLSISQEIIQLHNGDISVESKLNEGTKFLIRFPKG